MALSMVVRGQNQMTAEIINFYSHWKDRQEKLRRSMGYPADLWYMMLDNGYDPLSKDKKGRGVCKGVIKARKQALKALLKKVGK